MTRSRRTRTARRRSAFEADATLSLDETSLLEMATRWQRARENPDVGPPVQRYASDTEGKMVTIEAPVALWMWTLWWLNHLPLLVLSLLLLWGVLAEWRERAGHHRLVPRSHG